MCHIFNASNSVLITINLKSGNVIFFFLSIMIFVLFEEFMLFQLFNCIIK